MSTTVSSHPETSIWSAPSAPLKLHSRAREAETTCCAGVTFTKSLERIEIPQCIYESCDGLGLLSKDPIGFAAGDTNLYRMTGNHPNMATDPSGLEETPPYVGPSLDILNKHRAAGGLNYELRTVSRSELDDLNRAGLVSEYAYRDAQDLLPVHSRVQIAVSPRLNKGVNALEAGARIHGIIEMAAGACEATVGGVMCFTPAYPAGVIMLGHGGDHVQAGFGGLVTGIDQDTFVASGARYVGKNGLGLSEEGAKALGRITEFGTDIAAPAAASRMMYLRGLGQSTAYASNFDSLGGYSYQSRLLSIDAPVKSAIVEQMYGPFFHSATPETIDLIVSSSELWGKAPRNNFASQFARAKAHLKILDGDGVVFETAIKPDSSAPAGQAWWANPEPYADWSKIPIKVIEVRRGVPFE